MTINTKLNRRNKMESPLSKEAEQLAAKRYYRKDENGQIKENWKELVNRVVNYVCDNESEEYKKEIFDLIYSTKFIPNSPCLVNAGNNISGLLACFVSPAVEDSWVGMSENIARFGHVARRGGGNGVCLSKIRPENAPVFGSTHAKACGPIQHLRVISEAMSSITQAGFRGMANMATIHVDHPDIIKFINCKRRQNALKSLLKEDIFNHYDRLKDNIPDSMNVVLDQFLSNFNLSVIVSDDFMKAVENDDDWNLQFGGKVYQTVKARMILGEIIRNAHGNGDPGLIFGDRVNDGPYKYSKQKIDATNPCGEQPLPAYTACDLGSIDVSKFVKNGEFDWDGFRYCIKIATIFLDDVIDHNKYPTEEFRIQSIKNRPIGLGIMGYADLLLKLKLTYGSDESLVFTEELAECLENTAHEASVELAKSRGTPECCRFDELEYRRNVTLTSIAPTGSISILAGCSSSIEPIFSPVIYRYDNTGSYVFEHPDSSNSYFKCALDKEQNGKREVSWQDHIKVQSAFQKFGSSGISKTINMPNSATEQDVFDAYMMAWKSNCKGITVYRDGCKTNQILNTSKANTSTFNSNNALPRPKELPCDIFNTKADGHEWHVIVGLNDNQPYELFAVNGRVDLPKSGKIVKQKKRHYSLIDNDGNVLIENLAKEEERISSKVSLETRRFSLELRHGIPPKYIVQQINKSTEVINSFSKAAARIFKTKYLTNDDNVSIASDIMCPNCIKDGNQNEMICESGCWKCLSCFYSKCG